MNKINLQLFAVSKLKDPLKDVITKTASTAQTAQNQINVLATPQNFTNATETAIKNGYDAVWGQPKIDTSAIGSGIVAGGDLASRTPASNATASVSAPKASYSTPTIPSSNLINLSASNTPSRGYSADQRINGVTNELASRLDQLANVNGIIDPAIMQAIGTPFQASKEYVEAMNYTNQLLQQLSTGRTSYSDRFDSMLDAINNRDKFQYDMNTDTLFQQSLASAMASGQQAMQDTIGQASALTGGYGSSYATSAGNQQYNAFIQDAYANLPQYYNMALEAYYAEGDEMYKQLNALGEADAKEYDRNLQAWNANFSNAQQMYQNEYTTWSDGIKNAIQQAGLQLDENGQMYNNLFNYIGLLNDDYWKGTQFDESVRQFNLGYDLDVSKFNEGIRQFDLGYALDRDKFAESQRQFNSELGYKYANLNQANAQWQAEMDYKNNALAQSNAQWQAEYEAQLKKQADANKLANKEYQLEQYKTLYNLKNGGSSSSKTVKYTDATQKEKNEALDIMNTFGEEELQNYLESLPESKNKEQIIDYVYDHYNLGNDMYNASNFAKALLKW